MFRLVGKCICVCVARVMCVLIDFPRTKWHMCTCEWECDCACVMNTGNVPRRWREKKVPFVGFICPFTVQPDLCHHLLLACSPSVHILTRYILCLASFWPSTWRTSLSIVKCFTLCTAPPPSPPPQHIVATLCCTAHAHTSTTTSAASSPAVFRFNLQYSAHNWSIPAKKCFILSYILLNTQAINKMRRTKGSFRICGFSSLSVLVSFDLQTLLCLFVFWFNRFNTSKLMTHSLFFLFCSRLGSQPKG